MVDAVRLAVSGHPGPGRVMACLAGPDRHATVGPNVSPVRGSEAVARARPMLDIGANLKLPEEAVPETFAIL